MKRISFIIVSIFAVINLYAQEGEKEAIKNIDKLDVLDQQSKNFFKSITGLEKDYLEEQIDSIQNKTNNPNNIKNTNKNTQGIYVEKPEVSQEDYEKNVFKHQNEMARLTSDFTRTNKLKDIKIKSMYSFNGKDYVILKIDSKKSAGANSELSSNIEGRFVRGDNILGHKIIDIDVRTKTVKLYKKVDEEYGYLIYLNNYGTSVSDLKKEPKAKIIKAEKEEKAKKKESTKIREKKVYSIKESFAKIKNKELKKDLSECLYTVDIQNLNVRNTNDLNATILRVLKINDQFTIQAKKGNWLHLDTIYKKKSGDVMVVENDSNWVKLIDANLLVDDENCQ
ncbi:hypothetical protein [Poseidonibacter parvus]|nr:hypothetical protein [Poseidonibacter parvus]